MEQLEHWLTDEDPDELLLFHYTNEDKLRRILETGRLRMSPYEDTNDPRETKQWITEVLATAGGADPQTQVEAGEAGKLADRILRKGARLACFSLDRTPMPDAEARSLFHRGWARARMWDQYAQAHAGACLVFQRDLLVEKIDEHRPVADGDLLTVGRVEYVDRSLRIPLDMEDVQIRGVLDVLDDYQVRKGAAEDLYMTKNVDWASENEFRIVVVRWNLPDSELKEPLDIPFPPSLLAIVLGEAFERERLTELRNHSSLDHVEILGCMWEGGAPTLEVV